jgi:hypothetical protein
MRRATTLATIDPDIASIFAIPATTVRERQRELVRGAILTNRPGRGRGSGVVATADSIAVLIASLICSLSLTRSAQETKRFFGARHETNLCPFTGEDTFGSAFTKILRSAALCQAIGHVRVQLTQGNVTIAYPHGDSKFVAEGAKIDRGLCYCITLSGDQIRQIAALVAAVSS